MASNKEIFSVENVAGNRWRITGKSSQIRQHLSQFAMSKNIEILDILTEDADLEDVFLKLTKK
ncbi:MAG: hypothetical protein EBX19_08520 [Actinobacteria bacterium]|nr:hypothetical protein [Actinomycetota bacterium]